MLRFGGGFEASEACSNTAFAVILVPMAGKVKCLMSYIRVVGGNRNGVSADGAFHRRPTVIVCPNRRFDDGGVALRDIVHVGTMQSSCH
ncbi:hypothetical protein PAN31108_03378 [Pandoraea anhela]|uniref:Uncharacterized protein n=1 Tax=Pandoraea anhela TaxID=2508295 RepID=A0A5E4WSM3_9BURK|nr:hypothetical protein PAN31108_03378 [Pandoraea anhela]